MSLRDKMLARIAELEHKLPYGVTISAPNRAHGEALIEIRRFGQLVWRAWTFEPDFEADFERELTYAHAPRPSATLPL